MIFVTLGTKQFQMNRLVKQVDEIAGASDETFFVQRGNSTYEPVHCETVMFLDREEYNRYLENCDVLITHAAVGTILQGLKAGKPVIVMPRLARYNEHVDDYQKNIAEAFSSKGCVLYCEHESDLSACIEQARHFSPNAYESRGKNMEELIEAFIGMFDE